MQPENHRRQQSASLVQPEQMPPLPFRKAQLPKGRQRLA